VADRPISRPAGPIHRARWVLAVGAVVVAGGGIVLATTDQEEPARSPVASHKIVYEVTGPGGKSPEIRFMTDGMSTIETVETVDLPWRKELEVTTGPGLGIAQVMAANGQAESITCTVTVDGRLVASNTAKGEYASVSCSNMITPQVADG
jgi:hypothetical protein